jgi:hypothetical protein
MSLVLKAFLEVDDALSSDSHPFTVPPDPLGEFLERRTRVAPLVTAKQADECFEAAVKSCTEKMILFLQDPGVQARLRKDLPLFEED